MAGQKNQCIRESGPGELPHLSIMETFSARCSSSSIDNNKKKRIKGNWKRREKKKRNIWYSLSTILLFVCIFSPSLSCSSYLITSIFCGFGLPDTQRLRACRLTADVSSVFLPIFTCWLNRGKGLGNGEGGKLTFGIFIRRVCIRIDTALYVHGKIRKEKRLHHLPQPLDPPRLLCWFLETTFRLYSTFLSMAGLYRTNAHVTGRGEKNKDLDDKEEKTHLVLHTWTWWAASAAAVSARYWCSYFLFLA